MAFVATKAREALKPLGPYVDDIIAVVSGVVDGALIWFGGEEQYKWLSWVYLAKNIGIPVISLLAPNLRIPEGLVHACESQLGMFIVSLILKATGAKF